LLTDKLTLVYTTGLSYPPLNMYVRLIVEEEEEDDEIILMGVAQLVRF
jgi:hypothetical protein